MPSELSVQVSFEEPALYAPVDLCFSNDMPDVASEEFIYKPTSVVYHPLLPKVPEEITGAAIVGAVTSI